MEFRRFRKEREKEQKSNCDSNNDRDEQREWLTLGDLFLHLRISMLVESHFKYSRLGGEGVSLWVDQHGAWDGKRECLIASERVIDLQSYFELRGSGANCRGESVCIGVGRSVSIYCKRRVDSGILRESGIAVKSESQFIILISSQGASENTRFFFLLEGVKTDQLDTDKLGVISSSSWTGSHTCSSHGVVVICSSWTDRIIYRKSKASC